MINRRLGRFTNPTPSCILHEGQPFFKKMYKNLLLSSAIEKKHYLFLSCLLQSPYSNRDKGAVWLCASSEQETFQEVLQKPKKPRVSVDKKRDLIQSVEENYAQRVLIVKKQPIPAFKLILSVDEANALLFYEKFLGQVKNTQYSKEIRLEKHHIKPKHEKGSDEESNILFASIEDHTAIHVYRYLAYGKMGDLFAYRLRVSDTKERAKLRSENAVATNRLNKKGRFNPETQRVLGLRGGPKGGSRNTFSQQQARSKVGQTHGRATGMGNQSSHLKTILQRKLCWTYKDGVAFETAPAEAAIDIINQLNGFRPFSIKNASTFYKVFHNERKQICGWTLKKEKP